VNHFLGLCGPLEPDGPDAFRAPFLAESYRARRDPGAPEAEVPAYLLIEAMTQMACRASARQLFDGRRTVPAQIANLRLSGASLRADYALLARVGERHGFAHVTCRLVSGDGRVAAEGEFVTSPLEPPGEEPVQ
jgi:hypothetical protein